MTPSGRCSAHATRWQRLLWRSRSFSAGASLSIMARCISSRAARRHGRIWRVLGSARRRHCMCVANNAGRRRHHAAEGGVALSDRALRRSTSQWTFQTLRGGGAGGATATEERHAPPQNALAWRRGAGGAEEGRASNARDSAHTAINGKRRRSAISSRLLSARYARNRGITPAAACCNVTHASCQRHVF